MCNISTVNTFQAGECSGVDVEKLSAMQSSCAVIKEMHGRMP